MTLFIDGDALPKLLKNILFRAIEKLSIETVLVSNNPISLGKSSHITNIIVDCEPDEADHKIVELVNENDLVITDDIPLADRVISKKCEVINFRGDFYTADNIKTRLAMRNLMSEIRESGGLIKGPPPFTKKDCHNFANKFNRLLASKNLI